MDQPSDEIDKLLDEVNSLPTCMDNYTPTPVVNTTISTAITGSEQLNDYIVSKGVELIETGLAAIRDVQATSSAARSPEEIEAYSELIKSVTTTIDALNKINLQSMKSKSYKELKQMEVEAKVATAKQLPGTQTNILVATRDEFFKKILDSVNDKSPVINVESD